MKFHARRLTGFLFLDSHEQRTDVSRRNVRYLVALVRPHRDVVAVAHHVELACDLLADLPYECFSRFVLRVHLILLRAAPRAKRVRERYGPGFYRSPTVGRYGVFVRSVEIS